MGKVLYNYNVFDMQESKFILKNEPLSKVVEATGLPKDKVCQYAEHGYIHNGRYQIIRKKLAEAESNPLDSEKVVPRDIQMSWDDVIGAIKALQNGGHIVKVNGKPHHVEAVR